MARYLYSELASTLQAYKHCTSPSANSSQKDFAVKHEDSIESLIKTHMPSGSGFDSGTSLDFEQSHVEKLVFNTSFHHMDDGGYSGWTEHVIVVTPSFSGINIRISGRNRNDIKEYIHQAFDAALKTDVTYDIFLPIYPQFAITSKWEEKDGSPSQCYQAWYVGDGKDVTVTRFWNNYQAARDFAASQMVAAHNNRHSAK